MELNTQQDRAARIKSGIASVIAVPGSGKTLTMTHRIYNLVEQGASPESILGLTFTRNAAEAMRKKLRPLLGQKARRVHLSTIHSFCYKLLREEGKQFELLQGQEQVRLLKRVMQKKKVKNLPSGMILREISLAKSNLISPEEMRAIYQGDGTMQQIALVAEAYEEEKQSKLLLDFDDLLLQTHALFQNDHGIRQKYQKMYTHILVDEFQDTNPAQMAILKFLIQQVKKKYASFWVCGDDWQSIYSFTGASVGNIISFQDQFPEASQYILNVNYRSTPQILSACQNLIRHNAQKVDKNLQAHKADGEDITVLECSTEEDEAVSIVNEISDLIQRQGLRYQDIAVLYRANHQSRVIEEALSQHEIPYHIENGSTFFQRFEVRILLDYLRLIEYPQSVEGDEALRSVINVPNRYIGRAFVRELQEYAQTQNMHLYPALRQMPVRIGYLKRFVKEFREFLDPIIRDKNKLEPSEIIHLLRDGLDYDNYITEDDIPSPDDSKIANINQLQMVAGKYRDISGLLRYTDSFQAQDSKDTNGVSLMTIHKAKGLEFPVVFLIGLVEGILPNKQGDIEEERRIAFVGMSRAMHSLYLSYSLKHMGKKAQRSRFIKEIRENSEETEAN